MAVADQAVGNVDKLVDKLAEITDQVATFAQQNAPEAAHLVGIVYQMTALAQLIQIVPAMLLLGFAAWVFARLMPVLSKTIPDRGEWPPVAGWSMFGIGVASIAGVLSTIWTLVAISHLIDPMLWASVFNWKVAIAAHVLKAL